MLFRNLISENLPGLSIAEQLFGFGQTMCPPAKKHTIHAGYTLTISRVFHALQLEGQLNNLQLLVTLLLIINGVFSLLTESEMGSRITGTDCSRAVKSAMSLCHFGFSKTRLKES